MKRQLLILILISFSLSSRAADIRYYDVEVIIFQYLQADDYKSEHWPQQVERKMPESMIEIGGKWPGGRPEKYNPALSFTPLPEDTWRLTTEAEKIDQSRSRRLLVHLAWVQPGLPQAQAISVHFNLPVMATQEINQAKTDATMQNESTKPAAAGPVEIGTLDALIRVSLARYLRVKTDLLLTLNPSSEDKTMMSDTASENGTETIPAPRYFRVQQVRRRIRSTELHYLDHPVLGMLIMFTQHKTANKTAIKNK